METKFIEDETGADTEQLLCYVEDADHDDVNFVLAQPITDDGRSNFKWTRLQDSTLILGVYPRGDTYIEMSDKIDI